MFGALYSSVRPGIASDGQLELVAAGVLRALERSNTSSSISTSAVTSLNNLVPSGVQLTVFALVGLFEWCSMFPTNRNVTISYRYDNLVDMASMFVFK